MFTSPKYVKFYPKTVNCDVTDDVIRRYSIKFVDKGRLSTISSSVNIGCKLIKLWYSQARNILNSNRNWSTVTSLITPLWHHSKKFVNTCWLSTISSLVTIWCKLIKLLQSQVRNTLNSCRNRSAVTSLMASSWRHSIESVSTHITSTLPSLVKIGWKTVELSCSQAQGLIVPEMTSLMTS